MTNDNKPEPTEADLDRLLARIDDDLAISLARCADLPDASRDFGEKYANALHRVRRTLAMWQFEFGVSDQVQYRQTLMALASDLTVSGLSAAGNHTSRSQRTQLFYDSQRQLFKRLVLAKVIVNPSQGNQARTLLDQHGKPVRKH